MATLWDLHLCATSCLSALYFREEVHTNNPLPCCLAGADFLSLGDLASTGFLIGFSVVCTDYGEY